MDVWESVLACIQKRVSEQNFEIWFKPTSLAEANQEQKVLFVQVPNQLFQYWLRENFAEVINGALREANLAAYRVAFQVRGKEEKEREAGVNGNGSELVALATPCQDAHQCNLNPKYTFSRFVVGFCNQFAHAASLAVAERPANTYNPLFIYGGVGLGKTHLMHAIGHYIKTRAPKLRLTYMSAEGFMNELINSLRYDRTAQFRERFRSIDVLLMDDIQFLAGKERTQEEFFHTFNALYDSQKQIVISSDSAPREIPTLEERLHSRFQWGLIADLHPPDLETKVAILRKKAELEGVDLPDDVALFIASNVKSNVRELEGSLVRLIAYSSLTGEQIRLSLAERVLRNLVEERNRVITVEWIQQVVAQHYSLKVSDLKAKNNSRRVAEPRQVAMFLCRKLTQASLPEIGKEFGGKHHTTVLHSVRKVERLRREDPAVEKLLHRLSEAIRR